MVMPLKPEEHKALDNMRYSMEAERAVSVVPCVNGYVVQGTSTFHSGGTTVGVFTETAIASDKSAAASLASLFMHYGQFQEPVEQDRDIYADVASRVLDPSYANEAIVPAMTEDRAQPTDAQIASHNQRATLMGAGKGDGRVRSVHGLKDGDRVQI